jgi:HEAT repeat protein
MPFEAPPKPEIVPDVSVPPNTQQLSEEELKRAEALIPLLEGKQEYWAMGEFVHLGEPVVPVLVKALKMPGPRVRYNAIETLSMMKATTAVPSLLQVANEPNELPRVREHALRVAVRLDPALVPSAIAAMAKDPNPSVRKVAAFEARYVRRKEVIPVLIDMIGDEERFVGITAVQSLWMVTRHETEFHNWEASTKQDREEWAKEWIEWWSAARETFEIPEPRKPRTAAPQG